MQKKQAVILVILFLMAFTSQVASAETEIWIRVGLTYGKTSIDTADFYSETGFWIEGLSGERIDLTDFNRLSVIKDGLYDADGTPLNSPSEETYHLVIGGAYKTYEEAVDAQTGILEALPGSFPFFEGGWYLISSGYSSLETASAAMAEFEANFPDTDVTLAEPDFGRVVVYENDTPIFGYNASDLDVVFSAPKIEYKQAFYRSGILIKRLSDSDLTVINRLTLSEYLYGVVPKEMGTGWPIEALKAQAVAARNYALMNLGKYSTYDFDFTPGTSSQAYGGYDAEKSDSNRAVDETAGVVLTYEDALVECYYHAHSGGYTEFAGNVWSSDLPYLQPVEDPYAIGAQNTDWVLTFSKSEIERRLSASGYKIGSLESVRILERSVTGRVVKIEFKGTKGSAVLTNDRPRSIFGSTELKSMMFGFDASKAVTTIPTTLPLPEGSSAGITGTTSRVSGDGTGQLTGMGTYAELSADNVLKVYEGDHAYTEKIDRIALLSGKKSTSKTGLVPGALSYVVSETADLSDGKLTLYGHGYGHGVGLSQWGAQKMAELGFTYDQILMYYFKGTQIEAYQP